MGLPVFHFLCVRFTECRFIKQKRTALQVKVDTRNARICFHGSLRGSAPLGTRELPAKPGEGGNLILKINQKEEALQRLSISFYYASLSA